MGEDVPHRRIEQAPWPIERGLIRPCGQAGGPARPRQRQHPAQQAARRSADQPRPFDPPGRAGAHRALCLGRLDRETGRVVRPCRPAVGPQRAGRAIGGPAGADGRAQIHHRLRKVTRAGIGRELVHDRPDRAHGSGQRLRNGAQARGDPLHIGVDHHRPLAKGDGGDGSGGVGPDARQVAQRNFAVRKAPAQIARHGAGAGDEVARAGIIAKPGPCRHHRRLVRIGQRMDVRPVAGEGCEIGLHRRHGGLLQHDFAQPDAIGIGRRIAGQRAPRQGAGVAVIMREQAGRDGVTVGRVHFVASQLDGHHGSMA